MATDLDVDLDLDETGSPRRVAVAVRPAAYRGASGGALAEIGTRLRETPLITVALGNDEPLPREVADNVDAILTSCQDEPGVVVADTPGLEFDVLRNAARASSGAAITPVWLLRAGDWLTVFDALVAESTSYSMLLAGADFATWLRRRGPSRSPDDGTRRIDVNRVDDVLRVVLARPERRNAVDAAMRDAPREALTPAVHDVRLRVEISGRGPTFSAGGDLDEFGCAPVTVAAHLIRVTAGVGYLVHQLRDKITMRIHGPASARASSCPRSRIE